MILKKTSILASILVISMLACKSEFEKIRTSGDAEGIYQKAMAYYEDEEYQKAQTLMELVIPSYRGKPEQEDIYYKYAYTYYHLGRYILAAYYFNNFVSTYGISDKREEAAFMAAYSNYQLSPSFRLDQTYTNKAIDEMQLFINTYPESERVALCNELIDEMRLKLEEKAYEEAKLYFDIRQYQSSVQSFENVLRDFPETKRGEEVRYMIVEALFLLAQNSIYEKREERTNETIERANQFMNKYPKSKYFNEVTLILKKSSKILTDLRDGRGYQK